jgi:hypothetical protein
MSASANNSLVGYDSLIEFRMVKNFSRLNIIFGCQKSFYFPMGHDLSSRFRFNGNRTYFPRQFMCISNRSLETKSSKTLPTSRLFIIQRMKLKKKTFSIACISVAIALKAFTSRYVNKYLKALFSFEFITVKGESTFL